VLQIIPFGWLAALTSAVLLIALWNIGDLSPRRLAVLLGWFLTAGYCQFLGASALVGAAGLLLQTMLAIYLIVRWRLSR
jgi:hypothetical protein